MRRIAIVATAVVGLLGLGTGIALAGGHSDEGTDISTVISDTIDSTVNNTITGNVIDPDGIDQDGTDPDIVDNDGDITLDLRR